jgi:hypothetical protein
LLARGATEMAALVPHSVIDKSTDALQDVQRKAGAMHQIQQGLDTLNEPAHPQKPPDKPPGGGSSSAVPGPQGSAGSQGSSTSTGSGTPSAEYSDADRNGMNQLMKGAQ